MELRGSFTLAAAPGKTWDALADVRTLAGCMPKGLDVELDVAGERHANLAVRVRAGFIPVTLRGEIEIVDLRRPESLGMRATASALGTSATATIVVHVAGIGTDTTVEWHADVDIDGPFAASASSLLEREVATASDRVAACLARRLGTVPGPAADSRDHGGREEGS